MQNEMLKEQNKAISIQNQVSFALCLMLCFPQIASAIPNIINNILGHSIPILTALIYVMYYVVVIGVSLRCIGLMTPMRLLITIIFTLSLLLTYAFNEKTRGYIWTSFLDVRNNPMYLLLIYAFIAFLLSDYLHDVSRFLIMLRWFSTLSVILAILHYTTGVVSGKTPEYMTFSYNVLFPTAFLWTCSFSWFSILLAAIGTMLIFIAGCRGALMCLLLGIVLYYVFFRASKPVNRFLAVFFSVMIILILLFFWEQIMTAFMQLLEHLGISSRNVEKIINNDFLTDSGRALIQRRIRNRWGITGAGLFGDRTMANGHYSHSIFYELLADFGWVLGGGLLIGWLGLILFALIKSDEPGQRLLCVLLPGGCFKLFLSGSFLGQEPAFYMLLGVALNCVMIYKNTQRFRRDMYSRFLLNEKVRPHENIQQDLAQSKMSDQAE